MAHIAVTNQRARSADVIDVELRPPWDDRLFQWLPPTEVKLPTYRKRHSSQLVYRFPGPALEFGYDEVINGPLVERKKLPGQRRSEGLLLAIGGYMPDNLVHGQWVEMSLTIIGADHAEYSAPIRFWTERLPVRPTTEKARTSIFSKPLAELMKEEEAMRAPDATRTAGG